ncbi:MAG: hypothetical protein RL885_10320 [Planctomycetota bacterium]
MNAFSCYARLADLPLRIASYRLERRELPVSSGFVRVSTIIHLEGAGEEGLGEDVTYEALDQDLFQQRFEDRTLIGELTLDEFSRHLETRQLFPEPPRGAASRDYRRWAFESAALDLALRQAGLSLADAIGRQLAPVRFVVSRRVGSPPSVAPLRQLRDAVPGLTFKLDPTSDWDDAFVGELQALGGVETLDLKGAYKDTPVDQPADAELYRRVAETFPEAWIEDPALNDETDRALEPFRDRITWDAPIHSVGDIRTRPFHQRCINIKPSRFGRLAELFDAYAFCEGEGIQCYGGGQFELGVGRGQIQYLASLFHPDSPNDVSPRLFHKEENVSSMPGSPMEPRPSRIGFRWDDGEGEE